MIYADRHEAGQRLARDVEAVVDGPCIVAGIPRGGVIVAAPIAERLDSPLTLAFVRKIALPAAPELAVGALDEDGAMILERRILHELEAGAHELAQARDRVRAEIERQRTRYDAAPLARLVRGASVVLVDDGLATGLTMRAAVAFTRRHGARQVVVAVPCASEEAAARFSLEADRFVCPVVEAGFGAVGAYYVSFGSTSDDEVAAALAAAQHRNPQETGTGRSAPPDRGQALRR